MGVDAEDVNGDGLPDLFVTNYWNESNALYMNLGQACSRTRTPAGGMAADSMPWVGWGCALADFDNDGWPDCFVANGHVDDNLELMGIPDPYAEPPCCTATSNGQRFQLATRDAGAYFDTDHVGRARPSATSTTTATSTSSSTTRTAPRPFSATTRRRPITGSASRSSAPGATATPSVPGSTVEAGGPDAFPPTERRREPRIFA